MRQAVAPEVKHVPTKDMTEDDGLGFRVQVLGLRIKYVPTKDMTDAVGVSKSYISS